MARKHFDWRYLLLATLANRVAVFLINLGEGGKTDAGVSGIVQLFVSSSLAGFTIPYSLRNALRVNALSAYFHSSLVMASGVAVYGGVLHYMFSTPDLFWTIVWNFGLNACVGAAIAFLKRNEVHLPAPLKNVAKRL